LIGKILAAYTRASAIVKTSILAIMAAGDSSPARHLVFAGFYYLIGIGMIIARIVQGEIRQKNGAKVSTLALVVFYLAFFTWGTLSLMAGLGHAVPDSYDIGLRLGTLALGIFFSIYHKSAD
jgi:hypothetical protein